MKVVVIGGSGHIGSFLIPRLVAGGYEVVNVTRGFQKPYAEQSAWEDVLKITIDRETAEREGSFGEQIAQLGPDVLIDLICYTQRSAQQLVEAVRGRVGQFLMCGTIWVHGHSVEVPTTEDQYREPFGDYGIKKAQIEAYLIDAARRDNFPVSIIHPGHVVGPGWVPLNPQGNFNIQVLKDIKAGKEITLPNIGLETVHHVHADDVSQGFLAAMNNWSTACGEAFHIVSPKALTLRGYAEAVYRWFGHSPNFTFAPWESLQDQVSEEDRFFIWDHIGHSPCCSIGKARRMIGYSPRYTSLQALHESVTWLDKAGKLE
jgi:nucleoside-diphosphate-sugar epimerase